MWKVKIVFIFLLLLVPLAARAAEPTNYKCVCDYTQQGKDTDECNAKEQITVYYPEKWTVNLQKDKNYGADSKLAPVSGTFFSKDGCYNLIEPAYKAGVICGGYLCHLEAELSKNVFLPNGTPGVEKYWAPWYDLKWETALSTEANPIKVKEGESKTVEVKASGTNASIKISCSNCNPAEGTSVENLGDGKANVKFDTSKKDWLTGKVEFKIQASVNDPAAPASLLGSVWFDVEGVLSADMQTTSTVDAWISGQYGVPQGYVERGGALPPCAFSGTCRNINDLLKLIINFASGMFAIIGSFAFAFFVYGGFKMIVSMGSPEKVKSGKDAMIAAVIGMVIAFSAYAAINLLLTTLGVEPDSGFREIK